MAITLIDLVCTKCGHADRADLNELCRRGTMRCGGCGAPMESVSDGMAAPEVTRLTAPPFEERARG
jgi:hypothetical protein